jgi:hypothetical protein
MGIRGGAVISDRAFVLVTVGLVAFLIFAAWVTS